MAKDERELEVLQDIANSLQHIDGMLSDVIGALMGSLSVFRTIYHDKRKASKQRRPGKHTREQWQALKEHYEFTCLRCKQREPDIRLTKDHVDPKGSNDMSNIQCLCVECNDIKGDEVMDYRPMWKPST